MQRRRTWTVAAAALAAVALLSAAPRPARAAGDEAWVMLPFTASGVDATAAATFATLLQTELARTARAYFVTAPAAPCRDGTCAVAAARTTGARYVVWGDLRALGRKVIVTVSTADAERNAILCVQRLSAPRVEDLDAVAVAIGRAVAERRSVDGVTPAPAAAPGPPAPAAPRPAAPAYPPAAPAYPPAAPAYPPAAPVDPSGSPPHGSLDATLGFLLRVGGIIPLGQGYAGNPGGGVVLDLGFWWDKGRLGIEPRLGVRFDAVAKSQAEYVEVPIDVGAFFLFATSDVVPYLGGGLGARYLWERRLRTATTGTVLPATAEWTDEDADWGFGLYVRAGLMLKASSRGHTRTKLCFTADYNVAFLKVNNVTNPTSVILAGSIIF